MWQSTWLFRVVGGGVALEGGLKQTLTARDRLVAAVAAAALAGLYFALRSRDISYDALAHSMVADTPSFGRFFHHNHPLLTPTFWCAMRVFRGFGYGGSSLMPPAALSALWAGAAAGGFYLVLRRIGARPVSAALAAAGASFSAAWWHFAGLAEPVACIMFFTVGTLLLLTPWPMTWRRALAVGCWLGAGTWFHITLVLLLPVAGILVAGGREGRWGRWAAFFAAYAVTASAAYAVISQCVLRHESVGEFLGWINSYKVRFHSYGIWAARRFPEGLLQILVATVAPRRELHLGILYMKSGEAAFKLAPAAGLIVFALATISVAMPRLWREHRRWVAAAVAWFVGYQILFTWWECGNPSWWVGVTLPIWLLFGLAAPARRPFVIAACAVILAGAAVNFYRVILPSGRPGHNQAENAARVFLAASRPGDKLWVPHSATALWIRHLSGNDRGLTHTWPGVVPGSYNRRVLSLNKGGRTNSPGGAAVYLTDYELDNPRVGKGPEADAARKVFFKVLHNAEPVALIPLYGWPRVLYRSYGTAKLKSLKIYEAENNTESKEFRVLREPSGTHRFKVKVPEKGRWVVCVQARGSQARGEWPIVRVLAEGETITTFPVQTGYWWFYETSVILSAGKHTIDVVLLNGFGDRATGEKRFLYINRLALYRHEGEGSHLKPFLGRARPTLALAH